MSAERIADPVAMDVAMDVDQNDRADDFKDVQGAKTATNPGTTSNADDTRRVGRSTLNLDRAASWSC